jgi:ribosome-associated protein
MTQETAARKDTQRLQRAIVDGLEDVKAHDIAVFNTEHLSPLFERVIVASGTSNRQTKALAASVRDAVREAGFPKPRIEGEENGEWIIVDCGAAVAHIMQPAIRQYYHLEEIWGERPVRLKFGAPKPQLPQADKPAAKKTAGGKAPAKTATKATAKSASGKTATGRSATGKLATGKFATGKSATAGSATARSAAGKSALKTSAKAPAKKAPAKKTSSARKPRG